MRLKLGAKELTHRGPDEEGRFDDSLVSLGIQRLSIIDLTKELQPVYSESREVVAVMNGEIYNHIELSELLQNPDTSWHLGRTRKCYHIYMKSMVIPL